MIDEEEEIAQAEAEDSRYAFYDLEAHDHSPLSKIVLYVARSAMLRDHYSPEHMAADGWGNEVPVDSPRAIRFSLPGLLSKAATELFDPLDEKLEKDLKSKYDFRVKKAKKKKGLRRWKAARYYGYAWGLYNHASESAVGKPLHHPIDHQSALAVVEFARRELFRLIGVDDGSLMLGMARRGDMKSLAEIELLEKVQDSGIDGYRIQEKNVREILASYDLYRRGIIIETGAPWTYRVRHLKPWET